MGSTRDSSKPSAAGTLRERLPGHPVIGRVPGALLLSADRLARPAELPQSDALYAPLPEPRDQAVPEAPSESGETRRGVVQYDIS